MQNAQEEVVGIRLRLGNGRKLSVKGGREGLFVPARLQGSGQLLICEGPSDTAAMLDLAFNAIGRPSCTGGTRLLVQAVRQWEPKDIVIVSDSDRPGLRGANALAAKLVLYVAVVRVIHPPDGIKDARAWKQVGGTRSEIREAIEQAEQITVRIVG